MLKIRASLKRRGYSVWIDVEQMQGSTVDAMADAVDESYCIAYALSRECKAAMLSRFHHLRMIVLKQASTLQTRNRRIVSWRRCTATKRVRASSSSLHSARDRQSLLVLLIGDSLWQGSRWYQ